MIISSIIITITVTIITVIIIMHLQEGQQGGYGVPKIAAMTHKATIKFAHVDFRDMIAALPVVQRLQLAVCISCCASNLIHVVPHGLLKGHVCWPDGKLPCPNLHLFLFFCSKKSNVTSRTITTWIC